jgi:hypothetical protein
MYGGSGFGQKAIDIHGVYGCYNCHQVIDGPDRRNHQPDILRALLETQRYMVQDEVLKL